MTVSGALSDVLLLDALQVLSVTAQTGVLMVERAEERAELTFGSGRLVTAQLFPPRYHLASYFLNQGFIDFKTLHEALKRQARARERKLIGQILIEMGVLTHEQLVAGLQHHIRSVICELLTWTHGAFRFEVQAPEMLRDCEQLGVGFDGDDLRHLAEETANDNAPSEELGARDSASSTRLDEASWMTTTRLALVVTDDLLIRHGLELRLRLLGFSLIVAPGVKHIGELLLASDDPAPALVVDLDLVGAERTEALQTFHTLRKLLHHWPNLRVVTFGRQVPESFFRFMLSCKVAFHLPRAVSRAEEDIRVIQEFIEALAHLVAQDTQRDPSIGPPESILAH